MRFNNRERGDVTRRGANGARTSRFSVNDLLAAVSCSGVTASEFDSHTHAEAFAALAMGGWRISIFPNGKGLKPAISRQVLECT